VLIWRALAMKNLLSILSGNRGFKISIPFLSFSISTNIPELVLTISHENQLLHFEFESSNQGQGT